MTRRRRMIYKDMILAVAIAVIIASIVELMSLIWGLL